MIKRFCLKKPFCAVSIALRLLISGCAADDVDAPRRGGVSSTDAGLDAAGFDNPCVDCDAAVPTTGRGEEKPRDPCGNGLDDDGDGVVDNGCSCEARQTQRCYVGAAAQAGVGVCSFGVQGCEVSVGEESVVASWGACKGQGEPDDREICRDGLDNDCDGSVDEGCPCEEGAVQPCSTQCGAGERICHGGRYSECEVEQPPEERCNGRDDDCDGAIDEELTRACSSRCGTGSERCVAGEWSDCSAAQPARETCNGRDDDCDGHVDGIREACSTACGSGSRLCEGGSWSSCSAPLPAAESCNLRDDDCDGDVDEGLTAGWHFKNLCSRSQVFVVFGGCDVCTGSCRGQWVSPGAMLDVEIGNTCFKLSAFARTPNGDVCLDADQSGRVVGNVREFCNVDCFPQDITMHASAGGC